MSHYATGMFVNNRWLVCQFYIFSLRQRNLFHRSLAVLVYYWSILCIRTLEMVFQSSSNLYRGLLYC